MLERRLQDRGSQHRPRSLLQGPAGGSAGLRRQNTHTTQTLSETFTRQSAAYGRAQPDNTYNFYLPVSSLPLRVSHLLAPQCYIAGDFLPSFTSSLQPAQQAIHQPCCCCLGISHFSISLLHKIPVLASWLLFLLCPSSHVEHASVTGTLSSHTVCSLLGALSSEPASEGRSSAQASAWGSCVFLLTHCGILLQVLLVGRSHVSALGSCGARRPSRFQFLTSALFQPQPRARNLRSYGAVCSGWTQASLTFREGSATYGPDFTQFPP